MMPNHADAAERLCKKVKGMGKDIQQIYSEKFTTPADAASHIKSGDRIAYGFAHLTPYVMDDAIADRIEAGELEGLEFEMALSMRRRPYAVFERSKSIEQARFTSLHMLGIDRTMQDAGRDWFTPILFSEVPSFWGPGNDFDACCIQVTPMDENGDFNFGPAPTDIRAILKNSKLIIFEENPSIPVCHGPENYWNVRDIDFVVKGSDTRLAEFSSKPGGEVERQAAKHIMDLIEDGSTLQLGIGTLPDMIGEMLAKSDKGDFSIHTELFSDPYLKIIEAGKVTNSKQTDPGKTVYTVALGTRDVFDYLDGNPDCIAAPVEYVNNFRTISGIDKFISVNGCLNVDLYGQVCSESIGFKHITGTGGQLDFVLAAYASKGGKSFLCVNSTGKLEDGRFSANIRPLLDKGQIVPTPRAAVHYIVTEYGAVDLKGFSTWRRAEKLISIAHPDFRDELIREADKMGLWSRSSKTVY